MKTSLCLICLLYGANCIANIPRIQIENALANHQINAIFSYTQASHHKSIQTVIKNLSSSPICIDVQPGTLLESEFSSAQNHLITKSDSIILKPNETKSIQLTGMCCEQNDECPPNRSSFRLIKNHRKDLIRLCKIIDSLHLNTHESQTAIWALADKTNPNYILGADSAIVMLLRNYVGQELLMKVEPYKNSVYVKRVSVSPTIVFNNDGVLMIDSLIDTKDIFTLELYSEDTDRKIQTIAHERVYVYMNTLNLCLSNIRLNHLASNSNYIVRLKKNGVVNKEWLYVVG